MGAASLLCSYCQVTPTQPGSVYCCEACRTLAELKPSAAKQTFADEADKDLSQTFGFREKDRTSFECRVEPVACEACLMGLAKLPQFVPGLLDLQWNRQQSVLKFQFPSDQELPTRVFSLLKQMGLDPRWAKFGENSAAIETHRTQLLRLLVTGGLAANLMLFSIPIYAGLSGNMQTIFEWIQLAIFLPVLGWSARPFFRTAWLSLKLRQLSVDLPLAAAFLAGSFFSILSLLQGGHEIYFDSLAGFLFLILWSRFLLDRSLAKHLKNPDLDFFFEKPLFQVRRDNEDHSIHWRDLRAGDRVLLDRDDRVPVDGILLSSSAEFESSWIDGESTPTLRIRGARIQAGLRLISQNAEIEATKSATETDFAKILQNLSRAPEKLRESPEAKWGAVLVLCCFVAIFALFILSPELGIEEIARRGIALLIVACPCAVSFAAPLARARAAQLALKKGFWIRDSLIWDLLHAPKKIAFDKTGTLTGGFLSLAPHSPLLDTRWKSIILSLENISRHPIAEALRRAWGAVPLMEVKNPREIPGVGVEGQIQNFFYEIRRVDAGSDLLTVGLFQNDKLMIELQFVDSARPGLKEALRQLHDSAQLYLISGDRPSRVERFANDFSFHPEQAWGGLLPEEKRLKIEEVAPDLYVGDGTNDLPALQKAPVSVAMHGASLEAQAASDVLLLHPDVGHLTNLFALAKETKRLIRRNLTFALFYNLASGTAALLGLIRPFEAAVLMPIASFSLLLSTLWGTRLLRREAKK